MGISTTSLVLKADIVSSENECAVWRSAARDALKDESKNSGTLKLLHEDAEMLTLAMDKNWDAYQRRAATIVAKNPLHGF